MDSLVVDGQYEIPDTELEMTFSTSGGPGGQHANRAATRAILAFDLEASAVDESRSQWRNRQIARARMRELLTESLKERSRRRPTRPTRASQKRRVDSKKARGQLKHLRSRPHRDDAS